MGQTLAVLAVDWLLEHARLKGARDVFFTCGFKGLYYGDARLQGNLMVSTQERSCY